MGISDLKELIIYSLGSSPCGAKELKERDFLKNISEYGVESMLSILENKGKIYFKGGKFYAYKNTVSELEAKYGKE